MNPQNVFESLLQKVVKIIQNFGTNYKHLAASIVNYHCQYQLSHAIGLTITQPGLNI